MFDSLLLLIRTFNYNRKDGSKCYSTSNNFTGLLCLKASNLIMFFPICWVGGSLTEGLTLCVSKKATPGVFSSRFLVFLYVNITSTKERYLLESLRVVLNVIHYIYKNRVFIIFPCIYLSWSVRTCL